MARIVAAVAMAIALTGTAQAAGTSIDPASVLTAPASAYDWTGFYAGVTGGLGAGNVTIMMFDRPYPQNISGGLFGGTIGYNHQWNTFVLGIEGDLAGSGLAGLPVDASGVDADTIATTINWIGTARVRAGVFGRQGPALRHGRYCGRQRDDGAHR